MKIIYSPEYKAKEYPKLIIKEQEPLPCGTIYCEVLGFVMAERVYRTFSQSYFVCNEKRDVTGWFCWLEEHDVYESLIKQGYKLDLQ